MEKLVLCEYLTTKSQMKLGVCMGIGDIFLYFLNKVLYFVVMLYFVNAVILVLVYHFLVINNDFFGVRVLFLGNQ